MKQLSAMAIDSGVVLISVSLKDCGLELRFHREGASAKQLRRARRSGNWRSSTDTTVFREPIE
jgi:hypothetical protein